METGDQFKAGSDDGGQDWGAIRRDREARPGSGYIWGMSKSELR